jgi:hypothetical protein
MGGKLGDELEAIVEDFHKSVRKLAPMAEGEGSWRTCFSHVIKRFCDLFLIRITDSEKRRYTILMLAT